GKPLLLSPGGGRWRLLTMGDSRALQAREDFAGRARPPSAAGSHPLKGAEHHTESRLEFVHGGQHLSFCVQQQFL
ncbi:MAG: hypothetical protein M3505_00325, partial [Verrucomicrobiota bacterium]|nr:hypothetical protein [Verrucomicrobiota bacterium]